MTNMTIARQRSRKTLLIVERCFLCGSRRDCLLDPWMVTSLYINGGAVFSVLCGPFRDYIINGLKEDAENPVWRRGRIPPP
jgi:hypothetical protein